MCCVITRHWRHFVWVTLEEPVWDKCISTFLWNFCYILKYIIVTLNETPLLVITVQIVTTCSGYFNLKWPNTYYWLQVPVPFQVMNICISKECACPLYMSIIYVHYTCPLYMSIIHVHYTRPCTSIIHVHYTRPLCMSIIHVHYTCPLYMSIIHVHYTSCDLLPRYAIYQCSLTSHWYIG